VSWLLQGCLDNLPWHSPIVKKLLSLLEKYSPIEIEDDLQDVYEVDLGCSYEIELKVQGNPRPMFQWYRSRPTSRDTFERIDDHFTEDVLAFDNFLLEDEGTYYCYVYHVYDVCEPLIKGKYSKRIEFKAKAGSIHVTQISESSSISLGSSVTLSVDAISTDDLSFQWQKDDADIPGECLKKLTVVGEMSNEGSYSCKISNSINSIISKKIQVSMNYPSQEELENPPLANEKIKILCQPSFNSNLQRLGIGDVVHLKVIAACTNPLRYEWIRQGFNKDVTENPSKREKVTRVMRLPEASNELRDEIPDLKVPVQHWYYQCIITNAREMERVSTNLVRVPVSNFRSNRLSLPTFKIALIICQEEYVDSKAYCRLNACRNDGQDLAWKLKEMGFRVISFVNLSVQEARNAVELFCSMIDANTYAIFYINGHAMNTECGLIFPCTDTDSSAVGDLTQRFVLQREIEDRLARRTPLLLLLIYDSCRIESSEDVSSVKKKVPEMGTINYVRSYGTRQSMVNFDVTYTKRRSKGTFMKYLLKHVSSNESLGTAFSKLTEDFKRNEDQSVTNKMMPMYENCLTQEMSLTAELREGKYGPLDSAFFSTFSHESMIDLTIKHPGNELLRANIQLVLNEERQFVAIKSQKENVTTAQAFLLIKVIPDVFDNEAVIKVEFKRVSPDTNASHCLLYTAPPVYNKIAFEARCPTCLAERKNQTLPFCLRFERSPLHSHHMEDFFFRAFAPSCDLGRSSAQLSPSLLPALQAN
jgi:hypothetical protein